MPVHDWSGQWHALRDALVARATALAGPRKAEQVVTHFEIAPPATEDEVRAVEAELGQPIPSSFRRALREFAARVHIEWDWPGKPPERFRAFEVGSCYWNLAELPALQRAHRDWIENCFTAHDPGDGTKAPYMVEYDRVWHDKFPIREVPNGDMIGIDIAAPSGAQPVVYLSHEDGPCHGYHLGRDFEDYIDRLTLVGLAGPEDAVVFPLLPDRTAGYDAHGALAREWREWIGLP